MDIEVDGDGGFDNSKDGPLDVDHHDEGGAFAIPTWAMTTFIVLTLAAFMFFVQVLCGLGGAPKPRRSRPAPAASKPGGHAASKPGGHTD